MPYPAIPQPAWMTVPAPTARIGVPGGAARSTPPCSTPHRGPKHDVVKAPGIGCTHAGGGAGVAAAGSWDDPDPSGAAAEESSGTVDPDPRVSPGADPSTRGPGGSAWSGRWSEASRPDRSAGAVKMWALGAAAGPLASTVVAVAVPSPIAARATTATTSSGWRCGPVQVVSACRRR